MSMPLEEKLYLIEQMKARANDGPSARSHFYRRAETDSSFEQESYEMMHTGFSWFVIRTVLCLCIIGAFLYCDKTDTKLFGISKTDVIEALEQDGISKEAIQTMKQQSEKILKEF